MIFEIERLTYSYDPAPAGRSTPIAALDDFSLSIPAGSRIALVGANGSGKSTLLRILDGLYFGQQGVVRFLGDELSEDAFAHDDFSIWFRRQVGLVFQNPDVQIFNPTVFDEVAFGPLQMRWPESGSKRPRGNFRARTIPHRALEGPRASSAFGRREKARGSSQRAGARSRSIAAG